MSLYELHPRSKGPWPMFRNGSTSERRVLGFRITHRTQEPVTPDKVVGIVNLYSGFSPDTLNRISDYQGLVSPNKSRISTEINQGILESVVTCFSEQMKLIAIRRINDYLEALKEVKEPKPEPILLIGLRNLISLFTGKTYSPTG